MKQFRSIEQMCSDAHSITLITSIRVHSQLLILKYQSFVMY